MYMKFCFEKLVIVLYAYIFLEIHPFLPFCMGDCPPISLRQDLDSTCFNPNGVKHFTCESGFPPGFEIHYRCRAHFALEKVREKVVSCNPDHQWTGVKEYAELSCNPGCGKSFNATLNTISSYIEAEYEIGGEMFPWHVGIFKRMQPTMGRFMYVCGGTLVNPGNKGFFVLTAAHCVTDEFESNEPGSPQLFRIVLGAISTEFERNTKDSSQIFMPKNIIIENEYEPGSMQSNIAMIELAGVVRINEMVQPACFPTRRIASFHIRPGTLGKVPRIREQHLAFQDILNIPVTEQGECLRGCSRHPTLTEFCAIRGPDVKLTRLDMGSGIVFGNRDSQYFLQGILITVAGEPEGCQHHDTFTSVSVFLDWVNKVHEELSEGSQKPQEESISPTPPLNYMENQLSFVSANPLKGEGNNITVSDIMGVALSLHNFYRRLHQSPPVELSEKLSQEAQEWAEYLVNQNKWEFATSSDYSQNVFQYFGKISKVDIIKKAMNNWYNAIRKYNWNHPDASTFSQIVWKNTSHIGVGLALGGSKGVFVTNYAPKGNTFDLQGRDRGRYFRKNVLVPIAPPDAIALV